MSTAADLKLSESARRTLLGLEASLPALEWRAVRAWLATFYRFQLEWLLDWGRFSMLVKARQIGASHVYAGGALLWGMFGETTTLLSKGQKESTETLNKVKGHATVLAALGSQWAKARSSNATELALASGGRVLALPGDSGARSFSGNVILDEFAYLEHPEEVWDGAGGTVTHGYRLRVLSTPNGVGNLFHHLWTNKRASARFRKHEVTIEEAIADGMRLDVESLRAQARGDDRVFDQLFRCKFLDGDQQYIPSELIDGAVAEHTAIYDGETFGGLDIGRTNDSTTLYVVRRSLEDGLLYVQTHFIKQRTSLDDIYRMVNDGVRVWGCGRICVDATGMGEFPAEQLQKTFGEQLVEPVKFTQGSKEVLATTLYEAFAKGIIRIPEGDRELREDLASLRRIVTAAGNVRYDAPTTAEGHADRAWALALALHAAIRQPGQRFEQYERRA